MPSFLHKILKETLKGPFPSTAKLANRTIDLMLHLVEAGQMRDVSWSFLERVAPACDDRKLGAQIDHPLQLLLLVERP